MPRATAVVVPSDTKIFQAVDWKKGRCVATLLFFDHEAEYSFAFTQFKKQTQAKHGTGTGIVVLV